MIAWPVILQYAGQPELEYVEDALAWQQMADDHHMHFHRGDRVIDSEGNLYRPIEHSDHIELQALGSRISLHETVSLIQNHQAASGQCCVAKLSAPSIAECVVMLKDAD